ncbi:hypothetical protein B7463_g6897, partial [Scytalidium lignicola]
MKFLSASDFVLAERELVLLAGSKNGVGLFTTPAAVDNAEQPLPPAPGHIVEMGDLRVLLQALDAAFVAL